MSHKLLALAGASCLLLTGCIDDNYDLKDIDTTSEVKVNNLTLPINIDKMKLDDVFSIEDNSNIKIVEVNGERVYALSQTGTFQSDPIRINPIHIAAPAINPTVTSLTLPYNSNRKAPIAVINIPESATNFTYFTTGVDKAIYGMDAVYTTGTSLTISATLDNVDLSAVEFKDLKFQLPVNMEVSNVSNGTYDPKSGVWTVPQCKSANGRELKLSLDIDKMDLTAENPTLTFDNNNGTMKIDGILGLNSGNLDLDLGAAHPHDLSIKIEYKLTDINVTGLSGNIQYTVEGIDIAPVSIGDLPDFLKGEGTNIKVANPQLYLGLNNPVGDQKMSYNSGLRLTSIRDNGMPDQTFVPDNNAKIEVSYNNGINGPYNFLLAPEQVAAPAEYSQNLKFVKFSSLSDLLSVPDADAAKATLPQSIKIEVVNPGLPDQHADNFPLGRDLQPVQGKYELLAPLGFKEGSIVVYEDTQDGWSDDTLKDLTITTMTITATVDNDAPVSVQLESYAINTNGDKVGNIESNVLEPNKKDQPLTIISHSEIKDLDGIHIRAIMKSGNDQKPLSPEQTVTFKNVRVTVSGYYTTDF